MDRVDCRMFEDQLDTGGSGPLPDEAYRLLLGHAAGCSSCRSLLRLADHLPGPSLDELEARVPDVWVDEMEAAVRRALPGAPSARSAARGPALSRRIPWVPLLAAAVAGLLISNGVSLRALDRSRDRSAFLAGQLLDQQRRLADVQPSPGISPRPSGLLSREGWLRALEQRPDLTLAELDELLDRLPDDATLLGPDRTRELAASRWIPSPWREAIQSLPRDAGTTAGDLRQAIERIGLPDDVPIPTRRILDLFG